MSPTNPLLGKKILIGLTGSIAAYKVCDVISKAVQQGADVRVIATTSALKFVGAATLEGLSGHPVQTTDFMDGGMMAHIRLAQWAEIFLIAPATAQSLNSFSQGVGHSLLLSTFLAYDLSKPLLIAPAMNPRMLQHPSTQSSLQTLESWGAQIIGGEAGRMACGDEGYGRLAEPAEILKAISSTFSPTGKKILITAGGTRLPIDSVRSITNTSTGKTGARLAIALKRLGHSVHLLTAKTAVKPSGIPTTFYDTFEDLEKSLKNILKSTEFDIVIQSAAVSDFSLDSISQDNKKVTGGQKIESSHPLLISLAPNKKLISQIRKWSPRLPTLIGFKLTSLNKKKSRGAISGAVSKVLKSGADVVIHNELSEITDSHHPFYIYKKEGLFGMCEGPDDLAQFLEETFFSPNPADRNKNNRKGVLDGSLS